jgi:hypothetical protein
VAEVVDEVEELEVRVVTLTPSQIVEGVLLVEVGVVWMGHLWMFGE